MQETQKKEHRVCVTLGVFVCEGERKMHVCIWMRVYVRGCVCALARGTVCSCLSAFAKRRERIWQACLLSPQNNCLWITWGESHWRYLEMTLPGDSVNHVHIRSERGFDFCSASCVHILVCHPLYLYMLSVIIYRSKGDTLSLSSNWLTKK